jgi:DNA mismatch repair protein MutS
VTPIRRQYLKIKHAYPNAIVLFRLGDFYETFDEDAELASRELEITLTSRSMGKNLRVPMAGVPAHSLESYLARLVKKGHQVAICEQLTDPAASRGLVERDVVRVVTPGTLLEPGLLDQAANNYLASVVEEDGLAGLAYVDISTGEFATTQLDQAHLALELVRISPAEVLVPRGNEAAWEAPWWAVAHGPEGAGGPSLTPLEPSAFGLEAARQALLSHFRVLTLEGFGCEDLPLALRAAGAIIEYLAGTHKRGKLRLAALSTYSTASRMALDHQTRRNLELFQAGRSENKQHSLLGALDQTRTPMGGRLLRQWVGQPLLDLEQLNRRLDAVDHFSQEGLLRAGAVSLLARIPDLERIMGRVNAGAVAPREIKSLSGGLEGLAGLSQLLRENSSRRSSPPEDGGNATIGWLAQQLTPLPELAALIEEAFAADPAGEVGEGNIIREGFSPELDGLKKATRDARGFIAGLEQRERERTGIRGLRVGYNQVFGYYIEVSNAYLAKVPEDYIRRQTLANAERFIVPELKEYESLVLNSRERMEELERDLYRRLCHQIGEFSEAVGKRAAAVAQMDVFASLAEVAMRQGYVRPNLDRGTTIAIKDGRHPVVERVLGPGAYVPNDLYLSNDDARIVVLTGPNMAGKSTYIRQVAIITLMAQIGSFVPASEATIGLVDRIFTRVGLQDDLVAGRSTFMVEMVETAAILNQATSRSLVILDEVGRGTSTYDGLSIAKSVIEHLHNDRRLGCKTLFATHYHELTELADTLPGVRNYNVAVVEQGGDIVFLHRIVPGGADKSYGVHVAQLAGLPQGVINRAWEVLADLEKDGGAAKGAGRRRSRRGAGQQIPLFGDGGPLVEEILGLDIPNLTPLEAINILYELQKKAGGQSHPG